ncbi:hypothetical protein PENSPDRAFT_221171 [Peniophora sp. CONT]|nr:hypothetical protein PENSPDRAFT_221171 [Peniophora sp. CONT]
MFLLLSRFHLSNPCCLVVIRSLAGFASTIIHERPPRAVYTIPLRPHTALECICMSPRAIRRARVYPIPEDADVDPYFASNRTIPIPLCQGELSQSSVLRMQGQTLESCLLPTSAITVSCTQNRTSRQDRTSNYAIATYSGAVCLTIIAAAFAVAGSAPMTDI